MRFLSILVIMIGLSASAQAKIYIDITEAGTKQFPLALAPIIVKANDPMMRKAGADFIDTLKRDLELMSVFQIITEKGILEPMSQHEVLQDTKIDFSTWKMIDALAFTKGALTGNPNKLVFEVYLYDTLAQKEILAKRYSGAVDQVKKMAHSFGNTMMESLLGEKGIFDTRIAFVCKPDKAKELCLMDFNGDNYEVVTNQRTIVLSPTWNPTNRTIYYTAFDKKTDKPQLYSYDTAQRFAKRISDYPGMTIGLSYDPVQKLLATSLTQDGNAEIYLLNNYGDIVKRITDNKKVIDVSASFSPDGKEIVFVSDRDGSSQIYVMNRDGSQVKRRSFKGRNNTSPAWSPKGDKIAFAGMDTDGQFDILVMNTDGSGMNRLTYDSRNNEDPTWSPDGNLIGFTSNRKTKDNPNGKNQIFIMRPDGSRQTQITFNNYDHSMPSWELR
jgi:TolB protein